MPQTDTFSSLASSLSQSGAASYPSTSQGPDMTCTPDSNSYLFTVTGLPPSITSDMVTISANKGDRLRVNAQAWGDENPANFDWQISFPPRDVDLSHVQAKFDEGHLTILVPRYRAMLSVIAACCAF